MPERYLFRGSLLNRAATDKDFLARYAEEELTSGSKESGGKLLPEIRKRNKDGKDEEAEDERLGRNSLIDFSPSLLKVKNVFKNKICGDIFSSAPKSYDGVLYKSRITTSKETSEAVDTMTMDMDDHEDDTDSLEHGSHDSRPMSREAADELMKLGAESSTQSELEGHDIEAVSSDDESEPEDMTQRQQLAVTLRNYCKREGNVTYLLEEGAVVALCGLASIDDDRIRCA